MTGDLRQLGSVILVGVNGGGQPKFIDGTYLVSGLDADGAPHPLLVDEDGVLAVAESDSVGETILQARKTATESVDNSVTFQDDDHLFLNLEANTKYDIEGLLIVSQVGAGSPSVKATLAGTVGVDVLASGRYGGSAATQIALGVTMGTLSTINGSTVPYQFGGIIHTTTAGTLKVQWAQNSQVSGAVITVGIGSYLRLRKIP